MEPAASLPDSFLPELAKAEHEIRKKVDGLSDEGEQEFERRPGAIGPFGVERVEDERARDVAIGPKLGRFGERGRFENIGKRAHGVHGAIVALGVGLSGPFSYRTNKALEGLSEPSSQRGPGIRGHGDGIRRGQDEPVTGQLKMVKHGDPPLYLYRPR